MLSKCCMARAERHPLPGGRSLWKCLACGKKVKPGDLVDEKAAGCRPLAVPEDPSVECWHAFSIRMAALIAGDARVSVNTFVRVRSDDFSRLMGAAVIASFMTEDEQKRVSERIADAEKMLDHLGAAARRVDASTL